MQVQTQEELQHQMEGNRSDVKVALRAGVRGWTARRLSGLCPPNF